MNTVNSRQKLQGFIKGLIMPLLCVIALSAYPALFMYFQNADESSFSDILKPLLLFIVVGVGIFILLLVVLKNFNKTAIISSLVLMVILNYRFLEKLMQIIFPALRYWHVIPIVLFIIAHIAWFINKKLSDEIGSLLSKVICLVFSGLILLNFVVALPNIVNKMSYPESKVKQNITPKQEDIDLPNIYYLILDEYSSINFMKKYFNYDNSAFTQYLEEMGFNVSYSSHNESASTATVTTNLMNLDYIVNDDMTETEKRAARTNNILFNYLEGKGYLIRGIGNAEFYGLSNSASNVQDVSEATTVKGETISDILFSNTIMSPFYKVSYIKDVQIILSAFNYLKNTNNLTGYGLFTICHVECPHEPFYFDKDGNVYENPNSNWNDPKYYLGQYIFVTKQAMDIVDKIINYDPNCIFIIQSDHSARASSDPALAAMYEYEDKKSIFNAVYCQGKELDIEGLSGVNTLRLLLNHIFDENFDMIGLPNK